MILFLIFTLDDGLIGSEEWTPTYIKKFSVTISAGSKRALMLKSILIRKS